MRGTVHGVLVAILVVPAAAAGGALAQMSLPPTAATRPSQTLDRLHDAVTRPLPSLPPAPGPRNDTLWVPDRYVTVPGVNGTIHVPAHWEQRTGPNEVSVPALVGVGPNGTTVFFPAGVQRIPDLRQAP